MAIVLGDVAGWWDCQEGSGGTTNDESAGAHDGALGATVAWTTGGPTNLPNGLLFPGALGTSNVLVSNDYDLVTGSLLVWLNVTSFATTVQEIAGLGDSGESAILVLNVGGAYTDSIVGRTDTSTGTMEVNDASQSTATNYCYVYTWINSGGSGNSCEMFLNGVSVGTGTVGGTIVDTGQNFRWGARTDGSGTLLYTGKIHQVVLLNRKVDSTEAASLYNAGDGVTFSQFFGAPAEERVRNNLTLMGVS